MRWTVDRESYTWLSIQDAIEQQDQRRARRASPRDRVLATLVERETHEMLDNLLSEDRDGAPRF